MCFDDGTKHKLHVREKSCDDYHGTRYGPTHSYYPSGYYARPPIGPHMGGHQHHGLQHRQHHQGHFGHNHRHSYALPSRHALVPSGINYGPHRYHVGGRALMPSSTAMRTYYGMNPVMTGGAYSYSYPGSTAMIPPSTTTYTTVTNSAVPVPVATTTTSTTQVRPHVHSPPTVAVSRDDVQYENRRVAMERGSYNPKPIKPASARPDDPFWCMERTGEWHLRTYYQIENECYPGRWLRDAEHGFLVFHRQ